RHHATCCQRDVMQWYAITRHVTIPIGITARQHLLACTMQSAQPVPAASYAVLDPVAAARADYCRSPEWVGHGRRHAAMSPVEAVPYRLIVVVSRQPVYDGPETPVSDVLRNHMVREQDRRRARHGVSCEQKGLQWVYSHGCHSC